MSNIPEPRFKIGTEFIPIGLKYPKKCTVIDIWKTYNHKGELVKVVYVAEHEFLGQKIKDYDVVDTTIARGLIK